MKVRAILCDEFGNPAEVCRTGVLEVPEPAAGEVRVRMRFAPINPADINMIEGSYATKPKLPMVPGGEGVGIVDHLGAGVDRLHVGDHVLIPAGVGSWREALTARADDLYPVPVDGMIEQMAMLRVNPPTAYRMLHDFVPLNSGEWVLQNAANSGVGRSVIQIAKAKGWRTINVVRRAELIEELKAAGGDVVLVESADLTKQIAEVVQGPIRLALNAVGGESALRLASALARSGTLVTYGAMSRQPLRIPNGLLIFNDIRVRGCFQAPTTRVRNCTSDDKRRSRSMPSGRSPAHKSIRKSTLP